LQGYCACGRDIKSAKLVALAGGAVFFRATFERLLVETCEFRAGVTFNFTLTFHKMETTYDAKAANARIRQAGWSTTTNPAR